jgi:hypothetical protein
MAAADVFMDSSGFLAIWNPGDERHSAAIRLRNELREDRRRFITSDYIVDETVTLLTMRHTHAAAVDFLDTMERGAAVRLEWIGSDRYYAAMNLFRRHSDKQWSFTDCTTFTIMRELQIRDAFTSDHHFRQAGLNALLMR